MSTAIWPSLVKIGLKTKIFYHYAKFWQDPFLNLANSTNNHNIVLPPILRFLGQEFSVNWKSVNWKLESTNFYFMNFMYLLVFQKTRTVRVRVPYPHCTGAARTQILDSMDTNS